MPDRWKSDRWQQVGVNERGYPVYGRTVGGSGSSDYASMTKAELSDLAEQRGLPKSGTKDELIERLNG